VLWIFRRDCVLARALASPRMNFAIKAASEARPLIFSSQRRYQHILSRLSLFNHLPCPSPGPLVYSRGISLPHSSPALLTSAAIARSWNSTTLDIGLSSVFFFSFRTSFLFTFIFPPPSFPLPVFRSFLRRAQWSPEIMTACMGYKTFRSFVFQNSREGEFALRKFPLQPCKIWRSRSLTPRSSLSREIDVKFRIRRAMSSFLRNMNVSPAQR